MFFTAEYLVRNSARRRGLKVSPTARSGARGVLYYVAVFAGIGFFQRRAKMFRAVHDLAVPAMLGIMAFATTTARCQEPSPGAVEAVTIVTVVGKNSRQRAVTLPKDDVLVYEGQVRKRVMDWVPARDQHSVLQLAIVIDDADGKKFGHQLEELRKFILAQPPTTSVGIYYALGGHLQAAAQINPDHQTVAKALRLPMGSSGDLVSVYDPVMQLIAGWPNTSARREILLITEGYDFLHHERFSSDLQATVDAAQHAGILIHTIFVNARRLLPDSDDIGRSNLFQIAEETGGAPLLGDARTPESFAPLLSQLETALGNQYFLVWATSPSKRKGGELRSFKIRVEEENVRTIAPKKAFVP